MSKKKQIALWGCGNMGNSLARALVASGEARLIFYDTRPEAAAQLAERYGGEAVETAEALLSYPGLDGAIVALPPYLHATATIQAAEAGLGVLVEKPMALSSAECEEMIAAAERCNTVLMVGQVLRYYEPYRSIRRWVAEGRFGKLFAASITRVSEGKGFRVDGHWRGERAKCGGYLYEVGAHELDMLRCLMGRPQTVYAVVQKVLPLGHEIEDYVSVQVRFDEGGVAVYEGGGSSTVGRYGFRFHFEGATMISDAAFDPQALQIYEGGGKQVSLDGEFSSEHPVEAEVRAWLAALRDEKPVPIPGSEGLATIALAEAAYRSAATGQIVTFDRPEKP